MIKISSKVIDPKDERFETARNLAVRALLQLFADDKNPKKIKMEILNSDDGEVSITASAE